ncbi:Grh1p [Sporobolomyces salmoneus]|uniref:Grh1p n=1 Tax=Sporobolomyces salmoneus TaxID=183962 RepID=UPI00316DBBAE
MGQAESSAAGGSGPLHDPSLPANTVAFHVLRVAENSPAANAGLDPFFDFIVGINDTQLGEDIDTFTQILEENQGRQVSLMVYSTKRKEIRGVYVTPSSEWSSNGVQASVDDQPSLLGLSLRLCNPQHALEQVWHVLEVLEGSPAQSAGLVPFGDWIIGYSGGVLRGEGDFYDVVEDHTDRSLRLFVYNSDYDVTREAILVPNRTWGGEGLLGAGVGYGLLHRIPKPQDRPRVTSDRDPPAQIQSQSQSQSPYRPPPSASSSSQSQQFHPPPRSSTSQPISPPQSRSTQPVAPPPPRRTAAVSPPPPARSKYIPPPPTSGSSASPNRSLNGGSRPSPISPTRSNQNQNQNQQHPSFQPETTAISFGGGGVYDATEGVELVPTEEDGEELQEGYGAGRYSSPPPQGQGRYASGNYSTGGSPYRMGASGGRQSAI